MGRADIHAHFICTMQALLHAKGMIRKLLGTQDLTSNVEGSKECSSLVSSEKEGIKCSNANIDSSLSGNMSELLLQVVDWLSRAEVLQSLLSSNVTACLDDVMDERSAEKLRDRLIEDERYNMAVYCCTKCKVRPFERSIVCLLLKFMEQYGHSLLDFLRLMRFQFGKLGPLHLFRWSIMLRLGLN